MPARNFMLRYVTVLSKLCYTWFETAKMCLRKLEQNDASGSGCFTNEETMLLTLEVLAELLTNAERLRNNNLLMSNTLVIPHHLTGPNEDYCIAIDL